MPASTRRWIQLGCAATLVAGAAVLAAPADAYAADAGGVCGSAGVHSITYYPNG